MPQMPLQLPVSAQDQCRASLLFVAFTCRKWVFGSRSGRRGCSSRWLPGRCVDRPGRCCTSCHTTYRRNPRCFRCRCLRYPRCFDRPSLPRRHCSRHRRPNLRCLNPRSPSLRYCCLRSHPHRGPRRHSHRQRYCHRNSRPRCCPQSRHSRWSNRPRRHRPPRHCSNCRYRTQRAAFPSSKSRTSVRSACGFSFGGNQVSRRHHVSNWARKAGGITSKPWRPRFACTRPIGQRPRADRWPRATASRKLPRFTANLLLFSPA